MASSAFPRPAASSGRTPIRRNQRGARRPRVLAVLAVGRGREFNCSWGGARRRVSWVRPWVCGVHVIEPAKNPTEASGCIVRARAMVRQSRRRRLGRAGWRSKSPTTGAPSTASGIEADEHICPATNVTSSLANFYATATACTASHASSPTTRTSFRPSTPPRALMSATAFSAPDLHLSPEAREWTRDGDMYLGIDRRRGERGRNRCCGGACRQTAATTPARTRGLAGKNNFLARSGPAPRPVV